METIILILIYIYLNPFLDVCLIYDWLLNISRMGHNSVNWLKKNKKTFWTFGGDFSQIQIAMK